MNNLTAGIECSARGKEGLAKVAFLRPACLRDVNKTGVRKLAHCHVVQPSPFTSTHEMAHELVGFCVARR